MLTNQRLKLIYSHMYLFSDVLNEEDLILFCFNVITLKESVFNLVITQNKTVCCRKSIFEMFVRTCMRLTSETVLDRNNNLKPNKIFKLIIRFLKYSFIQELHILQIFYTI